jgi:hypothetical protein
VTQFSVLEKFAAPGEDVVPQRQRFKSPKLSSFLPGLVHSGHLAEVKLSQAAGDAPTQ